MEEVLATSTRSFGHFERSDRSVRAGVALEAVVWNNATHMRSVNQNGAKDIVENLARSFQRYVGSFSHLHPVVRTF